MAEPVNEFDKGSRYFIKRDALGFFRWLLHRPNGLVFLAWLDARRLVLPDQGDLTHDLVAAVADEQGTEGFFIEIESESAPDNTSRVLLGYAPRLVLEPGD